MSRSHPLGYGPKLLSQRPSLRRAFHAVEIMVSQKPGQTAKSPTGEHRGTRRKDNLTGCNRHQVQQTTFVDTPCNQGTQRAYRDKDTVDGRRIIN